MYKLFFVIIFISSISINNAKADSPLTFTWFYKAYSDVSIVQEASKTKGKLTIHLMDYLSDSSKPIDIKVAIINQLGWNTKGKNNSKVFLNYILKKHSYNTISKFKKGRADDLICYAYLKGMDNYSNVEEAYKFSQLAVLKESNSYTINLISCLLKSQSIIYDFCGVYKTMNELSLKKDLKMDFRPEGTKIIYEYINGYKKYCKIN